MPEYYVYPTGTGTRTRTLLAQATRWALLRRAEPGPAFEADIEAVVRKFGFSSKSAFNSFIGKQPAAYRARIGHTTGTGGGKAAAPMSDAHSPLQRAVAECFAEEQDKLSKDVGSAETAIPYAAAAAAANAASSSVPPPPRTAAAAAAAIAVTSRTAIACQTARSTADMVEAQQM